jgi:hypothetical protein
MAKVKADQGDRWLRASLYVLRRRAKARTNGGHILCPVINSATGFCDPLRSGMTAQATAQAHWSREYRKRRKTGIRVYELELPEVEVAEGLKRVGFLAAGAESHWRMPCTS